MITKEKESSSGAVQVCEAGQVMPTLGLSPSFLHIHAGSCGGGGPPPCCLTLEKPCRDEEPGWLVPLPVIC